VSGRMGSEEWIRIYGTLSNLYGPKFDILKNAEKMLEECKRARESEAELLNAAKVAVAGELSPSGEAHSLLTEAIANAEGR
jgi:hypothetical protein